MGSHLGLPSRSAPHDWTRETLPPGCLQLGGWMNLSFQTISKPWDEPALWFLRGQTRPTWEASPAKAEQLWSWAAALHCQAPLKHPVCISSWAPAHALTLLQVSAGFVASCWGAPHVLLQLPPTSLLPPLVAHQEMPQSSLAWTSCLPSAGAPAPTFIHSVIAATSSTSCPAGQSKETWD